MQRWPRVARRLRTSWSAKYDGAPTTAIRMSGRSKDHVFLDDVAEADRRRRSTMSIRLSSTIISTPHIGMRRQEAWQLGRHDLQRPCLVAVTRNLRTPCRQREARRPPGAGRGEASSRPLRCRHRAGGTRQPHPGSYQGFLAWLSALRHTEFRRRAGKAALRGDDREGGKVVQIVPFHLCTRYISPSEL